MHKKIYLWLVLFVVFVDEVGVGLVYPMFSSMIFHPSDPLGLSHAPDLIKGVYLGILLAALPIAAFFSGPILGSLSDQKGRRPLYLVSLSLAILGYLLSMYGVWIQSIFILISARCIVGIAAGNAGVVSATIADISTPENKASYFGLYSMAAGLGFMIGPVLGGVFSKNNFLLPFSWAAIASIANLVLIFFLFQETHQVRSSAKVRYTEGLFCLQKAFRLHDLKFLFFTAICFCFGWSFFYEFLPVVWLSDFGFNTDQVGMFYAYGSGFYALSSGLLIRPFQKRFRRHSLVFYSLAILGGVILAILFLPHPFWIWIYLPIVNFLIALTYPTYSAIISDSVDENSQGEILGISQSIQMFSFGISPLLGGTALGLHPHSPMLLGGGFMWIGAAILGLFLKKKIFRKS